MNIPNIYIEWLKTKIKTTKIEEEIEFITPFLDSHNDHIHFYIRKDGKNYIFSDNGYTINDLSLSGCNLKNAPQRERILEILTNGYGVIRKDDELSIVATKDNLAIKIHMFLHSLMSVSNMFMLSEPNVRNIFFNDVRLFFDINEIRYTPSKNLIGNSGLPHEIDIYIETNNGFKGKLISTLNTPTPKNVKPILYTLNDINDYSKYIILNDKNKVSENVKKAILYDKIQPIPYSQMNDYLEEFKIAM